MTYLNVYDCPLLTHRDGACDGCGRMLTGRKTRWCSRKCQHNHVAQHRWTQAKAAAKKKAQQAVKYVCADCGESFAEVEVNHIAPCKGKHGQWGCWHHSDNLEVLCIPCHRAKTNEQRERGWT